MIITKEYLRQNPDHIFVFGDNLIRKGKGGAAILRDEPNVYGFITKKFPSVLKTDYYQVEEYIPVFHIEMNKLIQEIEGNPNKTYLISKLGAGLANKYQIWENVIEPNLKKMLEKYENVKFLF